MRLGLIGSLLALALAAGGPAWAQGDTPKPEKIEQKPATPDAKPTEPDSAKPSVIETAQPRKRSIPLNGATLAYTVTPGTLTIRNDEGEPTASVFYTAYTVQRGKGGRARPVTFLFNGGPGSSTMWLHMGSFGPLKIDASTTETVRPAPYRLLPNPDTLLDRTDLVFIDAVTTGLSRPLGKSEPKDFFGVDQDLDAFTRAIQRYLTVYGRWDSPKFVIGESYGTLRAAGLAYSLQQKGVQLNGVALVSSVLDIGLLFSTLDHTYVTVLPTYAATAWYHNRIPNRPADLNAFLAQVRTFAAGPYAAALFRGDALAPAERDAVARQLAAYTGLSPEFILRSNLRVGPDRFRKELMRGERRTVGRLDSRFVGIDPDAAGEGPEFDPTDAAISGAFVGALNNYLFHDLGFQTPLTYRPNNYSGIAGKWDWKHAGPGGPQLSADTSADLAATMRRNPRLKVISVNGLYDMATPFFGADYDLSHMLLEPEQRANVTYTYYPAGHMMYIDPASARQLKTDLAAFYDSAS
ncbi:MAG TPA: peptidase S10 [Caulobacteraceae bacterium]|jgi:carboxypeptidase C (cathepsin A)